MQILASALPGFRDLRAPLTAGYLWLIFLWIVLKPDLTIRPTNDIAGAIYDLGKSAGPIWIGLAIGIAAYLVGAVSQVLSPALSRLVKGIWDRSERVVVRLRRMKYLKWLPLMPVSKPVSPLARYLNDAVAGVRQSNRDNADLADHAESYVQFLAEEEEYKIERDLSLPSALLLTEASLLFTETDRLKAEKQFRVAIIAPLLAIFGYLSVAASALWLFGGVALCILLAQSHVRQLEYNRLMYGALERGLIESDSVKSFRQLAVPD